MIVGFTGSGKSLTVVQIASLADLLKELVPEEAHHGDCIGGDAIFDALCETIGVPRHSHPGTGAQDRRAYCRSEVVHEALPYMRRNDNIVAACDTLVACPDGPEHRRSGTWATVRRARAAHKPIIVVWPNGRIER